MKGLLEYEKGHNAFLRELSLSLKSLASSLTPDEHLLIVPQNVSIEQLIMSRQFAGKLGAHESAPSLDVCGSSNMAAAACFLFGFFFL